MNNNNCMYTAQGNITCDTHDTRDTHDTHDTHKTYKPYKESFSSFNNTLPNQPIGSTWAQQFDEMTSKYYNKCTVTTDKVNNIYNIKCADSNLCNTFAPNLARQTSLSMGKSNLSQCSSQIDPKACSMKLTCSR